MKNITWILVVILLLSLVGNWYQDSLRKKDRIKADLDKANSNTVIAQKNGEIIIRDSIIAQIREERRETTVKDSVAMAGLKKRVSILIGEIAKLPKVIQYNPDSATVDSLRVAFVMKDSVIDTQSLMIMNLEAEKQGLFSSFTREVQQLTDQRYAQVVISNQLQQQLVAEQANTRREVRRKKFFRFLAGVGIATAGVLAITK